MGLAQKTNRMHKQGLKLKGHGLALAYASAHVFPEPTALEVQLAHGDGESSTQLVAQIKEDLTLKVDNYQSHGGIALKICRSR